MRKLLRKHRSMPKQFTTTSLDKSPQELRDSFLGMRNRADVARFLDLDPKQLLFHLYVLPSGKRYKKFSIPKKTGGVRVISAPISPIKIIQRKLKQALEVLYVPKPATQGFVATRSIVTNAIKHRKRRYVLNLDLADFFPTIHFGRVRGIFMATPYSFNNEVATILAQICCHEGTLPQGAPTSPVVSNMICARLDAKLQQLAKAHQCTYSRYADDITFSTSRSTFPAALAHLVPSGQVELGSELQSMIEENGFKINEAKTRLQIRQRRQEVTGLVVNRYPNVRRRYVRQVRAILHAWSKYGLASTAENYLRKHAHPKYLAPGAYVPSFQKIVSGKIEFIGMVKGHTSPVYLGLLLGFHELAPDYVKYTQAAGATSITASTGNLVGKPFIYTEGKTDRKHLRAALRSLKRQGQFPNLDFDFPQTDEQGGDWELLDTLEKTVGFPEPKKRPHIFIFDRDNPKLLDRLGDVAGDYTSRGEGVYYLLLPIPKHREGLKGICIELYYRDEDIVRRDQAGHRLYLNSEFEANGILRENRELSYRKLEWLEGELRVIDDGVMDGQKKNVALSKNAFADHVLEESPGFENMDFSGFVPLFERTMLIANFYRQGKK